MYYLLTAFARPGPVLGAPMMLFHFILLPTSGNWYTATTWWYCELGVLSISTQLRWCPRLCQGSSPIGSQYLHMIWECLTSYMYCQESHRSEIWKLNHWCVKNDSCSFSFYRKIEFSMSCYGNVGEEQSLFLRCKFCLTLRVCFKYFWCPKIAARSLCKRIPWAGKWRLSPWHSPGGSESRGERPCPKLAVLPTVDSIETRDSPHARNRIWFFSFFFLSM